MILKRYLVILFYFVLSQAVKSQSITNGDFSLGVASWSCGAETNPESVYGGGTSNSVAEVDAAAGLCQAVTGLTIGNAYVLSFIASRRVGGCSSPPTTNVNITVSGGVLATTVTRTNTTFGYTSSSYLFVANSATHVITFAGGSGFGGSTCGMIIDNISVAFSPLPIELVSFQGELKINTVKLIWSTASENNNHHFDIEKSENGMDFKTVFSIPTKSKSGDSYLRLNYEGYDTKPSAGTNYYRLKQIDNDGTFSYSKIISIEYTSLPQNNILIYPNPNNGNFTIECKGKFFLSVILYDCLGQIVYSKNHPTDDNNHLIQIYNKDDFTPGIYHCVIYDGNYFHSSSVIIN